MAPRGIRNNNPLNIRKGNNWQGERHPQTDPEFEEFKTLDDGCRAACILMRTYIVKYRCNTVAAIINRWAPPSENDTSAYLQRVCKITNYAPNRTIRWAERGVVCFLLWAMAQVECGQIVPLHHFERGYAMA